MQPVLLVFCLLITLTPTIVGARTAFDAAEAGDSASVLASLDNGLGVNSRDVEAVTLLHRAARGGQVEVVALLVARGANVNVRDVLGATPLHYAAHAGVAACVEFLLAHGADVNALNACGELALHWAAQDGRVDVVRALLAAGSQVNVRSSQTEGMHHLVAGRTPLELANDGGYWTIAELLRGRGARDAAVEEPSASLLSNPWVLSGGLAVLLVADVLLGFLWLARRAEAQRRFREVLAAVQEGRREPLEALLATAHLSGVQLTALLWAAVESGQREMAALLLDGGADAGAEAPDGTPLLLVARQKEDWDMAALLLAHGAQEPEGMPLTGLTYSPAC